MSFRISSKTEMAKRTVTLKPNFSPLSSSIKKDARSRARKYKIGSRKMTTYSRGLLLMVICMLKI